MTKLQIGPFKRITKLQAIRLFNAKKEFYICPVKMAPGGMWHLEHSMDEKSIEAWMESAKRYQDNSKLWYGTIEKTAWNLFYNNWAYYNTNYEVGHHASYWIKIK
jgi:hypothetical protein